MNSFSLLLFVTLGVSLCVARVQPPVSISLTTKWRTTSLSCEALEFVATETPKKYWPFVESLLNTPQSGHNDYFPKETIAEILTQDEIQQLKMAMDLRLFSPRVAMHYQVADQEWKASNPSKECQEKNGTWVLHTPSLTSFCSVETIKNFVMEKEACSPSEGAIHLPQDLERFSEMEGEREWVLYSDLEEAAPFFSYFNEHKIPFIFRYNQKPLDPSDSEWEPTTMQGYGVRIDLKKMEYKVVDDSSSSGDEEENDGGEEEGEEGVEDSEVHGFYFKRLAERKPELEGQLGLFRENLRSLDISPDESVEYYKSVKPWDLKRLPLRAAQRILKSKDPLSTLLDITQNLPSYAKSLSKVKVDPQVQKTLKDMTIPPSFPLPPGTNALLLNNALLPSHTLTPLSLYTSLSSEIQRSSLLHSLSLSPPLLPLAITSPKLSPSLLSTRFNIRSKAVTWVHSLSSPEYQNRVPSSLTALLSTPPGQISFHSKHPATLVLGGDPSRESFRDALTEVFMRVRQGFALRVGLVMASNNPLGTTLINCFHFLKAQYNEAQALSALISLSKFTDVDQLRETLAQNGLDPEVIEAAVLSDSKLRKKPRQAKRFLEVIGVDIEKTPWEATVFVNGIPILVPEGESFLSQALEVAVEEYDLVKELIRSGKINEKSGGGGESMFYNYLLSQEGVGDKVPKFLWEREAIPDIFKGYKGGEKEEGFFGDFVFLSGEEEEGVRRGEMVSYVVFGDFGSVEGLVLMRDVLDVVGVCGVPRAGEMAGSVSGCAEREEKEGRARVLFLSSKSGGGGSEVVVRALQAVGKGKGKGEGLKFVRLLVSGLLESGGEGGEEGVWKVVEEVGKEAFGEEEGGKLLRDLGEEVARAAVGGNKGVRNLEKKEKELREAFEFKDSDSVFGMYSSAGMSQKIVKEEGFSRSSLLLVHRISLDSLSSLYHRIVEEFAGGRGSERLNNDFFLLSSFLVHNGHEDSYDISGVKSVTLPSSSEKKVNTLVGVLDPISSEAHKIAKMMMWVANYYPEMNMKIILNPRPNLQELPTKSYYQYVLSPNSFEEEEGKRKAEFFEGLPQESLLTVEMEVDPSWLVLPVLSVNDLDNLKLVDIKEKQVVAQYEVASLLYQGQCFEGDFRPPQGLQLYLGDSANEHLVDTTVMMNGYFQLQALPGVWSLSLAEGKARDAYTITEEDARMDKQMVVVSDYVGDVGNRLNVRKRPGMEDVSLLSSDDDMEEEEGSFYDSWWTNEKKPKKAVKSSVNDTIHVFSLASGHLYERFLKIMALSVLKNTNNPVKFWFVANFLSPQFKTSLAEMAKEYNFDFEFVTYQWPWWLHEQTEKQRRIWGYKILFLDVLFPLNVEKVIYVDADQIVRADLKELVDMDLEGAVYGFTPMCNDRTEMEGFRFWRQGYWKDHLGSKPYHISALYVVDLVRFRNMAAGDRLRSTYDSLSQDKNSLANLDQDLPNFMQHQLKIFSLPQEWLWCETWCSDESKPAAKTIDLCNNPLTKTPKLENAVRIVKEWTSLDEEARSFV